MTVTGERLAELDCRDAECRIGRLGWINDMHHCVQNTIDTILIGSDDAKTAW
jgi:hypothetical protein